MREAEAREGTERPVRVSFVLSTKNRASHLERALQGARELVGNDDELILVDGGSTDRTAEVARAYADVVSLFVSEPDTGEAHGLNRGLLRARGRFIKQLTDDDVFFPEGMRAAIAALEAHPEIDALICGGEAHEFDAASGVTRPVEYRFLPKGLRFRDDLAHILRYTQCGLGLVLRRRALERAGLFDTTYRAVDTDYMARLLACGCDFRYLDVKLFRHVTYLHSGQHLEAECLRDRARVVMRSGAWSRIDAAHDPDALARALGLDAVAHGTSLARILWWAERIRRSPFGGILRPAAAILGGAAGALRLLRRGARRVLPIPARGDSVDLAIVPEWVGSLR